MFDVPDGANRVIGNPWKCVRCDVGENAPGHPACWNCGLRDEMVPGHLYRNPASSAYIRYRPQEAPDD